MQIYELQQELDGFERYLVTLAELKTVEERIKFARTIVEKLDHFRQMLERAYMEDAILTREGLSAPIDVKEAPRRPAVDRVRITNLLMGQKVIVDASALYALREMGYFDKDE